MMMNNHTKKAFTVISSLLVAVALILAFAIYSITAKGNEEIEKYRAEEIQRLKQYIKDSVEMAYATIDANYKNSMDKVYLEKYYGPRLKNIIDVAETILNSKAEAFKNGELTRPEAQAQAAAEIKKIRYNNGEGYVWITDSTLPYPKMIMHPTTPSLDGQVLDDPKYNCALGKEQNLFNAAVEICLAHGKGFVDYLWPKQTQEGVIPDVPKLAYVRLFPEWNWLLGTAIYVDDAIIDAIEKSKDDIRQMRYNNGNGYFWISSATKTNLKMIVHPTMSSLEGQILEGKLKNLFESFIEICEKLNGSGFLEYTWPKPTVSGLTENVPKLSYVKLYEPLGWIVGTDIYIDSVDQVVAGKKELVEQQITILILKIVAVSLFVIFLIGVLIYIMNRYFSNMKPQQAPVEKSQQAPVEKPQSISPVVKAQPASISKGENPTVTEEIPVLSPAQESGMLRTDDCIKMVQEISKTLIAEHAKLLATVIHKAPQSDEEDNRIEVSNEVKKLTNKTDQTIEDVKKMVETNQQQPHAVDTTKNAKFNKVVGNLNQMVGNMTNGMNE